MMISLNASMRNTLLSLRNISAQQDNMQLILSTGKKVNSAIDNPSSYYQATSLTNRAADLLNLLNSMEQGIQTIQAANTGVDTALNLLEQMEAIANQAGTQAPNVPSKEYFENLVGANGAVVTTAEELRNAIAANKETICIYGAIDLGDISTSGGLELKANQKLVGIGYFGNFDSDIGKFSSITATDSRNKGSLINVTQNNCLVDGLSLNYTNMIEDGNAYVLYVDGTNITTDICNLDIQANFSDINTSKTRAAIRSSTGATVNVDGDININTEGREGHGFLAFGDAKININAGAKVKIQTQGASSYGLYSHSRSTIEVNQGTMVDIKSLGTGTGVLLMNEAVVNISGKLAITTTSSAANGIRLSPEVVSYKSNNRVTIDATAEVYFNTVGEEIMNAYSKNNTPNVIEFAKGAKIAFHKNGVTSWYQIQENGKDENTSTNKLSYVNASNITQKLNVSQTSDWKLPSAEINFSSSKNNIVFLNEQKKQFNDALSQYDQLIKDSYYKGINLLKGDSLKINFNETGEHNILVQGKDITSNNIGLSEVLWQSLSDVSASMDSLKSAVGKLRSLSEDLGSQFNIIQTRIDFTSALTNVLEEGADKLTLADMNEASAQYLTLQTRQSLAINSLSLAAQSSRGVLQLFY